MNGDKSAGANTRHVRARTLAAYRAGNPNTMEGGKKANVDSSVITVRNEGLYSYTRPRIGVPNLVENGCCISSPYTTYYLSITTTGSTTWTAPDTVQGPITYWIVGGGGGGGGAYDNAGGGGGGGGVAITGTRSVVAGASYTIVVGAGGAGGTGRGSSYPNPAITPGTNTDGTAGANSSFDLAGGGPVAAGGGAGKKRDTAPTGQGGGISAGGNGSSGGGTGGGGGGAGGSGTNGGVSAGTGGTGISYTIPGYNGGNSQSYGTGGNGGANIATPNFIYTVGATGTVNTGNGGGGGGAASYAPALNSSTPLLATIGGAGGSGLVVIQYTA